MSPKAKSPIAKKKMPTSSPLPSDLVVTDSKHVTGDDDAPLVAYLQWNAIDKVFCGIFVTVPKVNGVRVVHTVTGQLYDSKKSQPAKIKKADIGADKRFKLIKVDYEAKLPLPV